MKIKSLRLDKLIPSDYKVHPNSNPISNWIVDVKMAISLTKDSSGAYEQVIQVIVTKNATDKTVVLKVSNVFSLFVEGTPNDEWNDENYWQYADLMQASCCHARALFAEISKNDLPNVGFFALQSVQYYYNDLKTRYKQIWN